MADNIWLGVDTDWNNTSNWSLGTIPVAIDTVIFNGNTTTDALLNLDQGIDTVGMHVMESYLGTIGAAGSPLEIECNAGEFLIEGQGDYYIQAGSAGPSFDGQIARMVINTKGNVFLSSTINGGMFTSRFVDLIISKGTVVIYGDADKATTGAEAGTIVDTLIIEGGTVTNGDSNYDVDNTAFTNLTIEGGTLNQHSTLGTVDQYGGRINMGTTAYSMGAIDDTVTTLNMHKGTFNWQPSVATVGTSLDTATAAPVITTLNLYGGTFDATDMLELITTAPTITTAYIHPSSKFNIDNKYAQFIVTTLVDYGGSIAKSSGQDLTLQ